MIFYLFDHSQFAILCWLSVGFQNVCRRAKVWKTQSAEVRTTQYLRLTILRFILLILGYYSFWI